jgi:putative flippase GtrA
MTPSANIDARGASRNFIVRLWLWGWNLVVRYALKFGAVGLLGYFVDVGIFNALSLGVFGRDHFFQSPIGAKLVSVTIATIVTWFGNRYWTFREHRRKNFLLELFEFAAVSVGGLLIGLVCLWISHYLLGLTSLLADNISTNVIGLVLGTAFRFVLYRFWVYGHYRKDGLSALQHQTEAAAMAIFEGDRAASGHAAAER